jgi:DNA-binding transcriptional LysR family regulator
MREKKHADSPGASIATVLGDVIGSRGFSDRRQLHARLVARLEQVNDRMRAEERQTGLAVVVAPMRVTAGDEYQGTFTTLGGALRATGWLRLVLMPDVDVRHGLGWGPVEVLEDDPRVEDGPGWWQARAAVVAVEEEAMRPGHRRRRTAYRRAEGSVGPDPDAVNAALVLRDELLGGLSNRSLGVLRGLLAGRTQQAIAEEQGVSPSAVSQRIRNDGLAALIASDRLLGGLH